MSFSGEFATRSKAQPTNLGVVLEVTLNSATWDRDGTLTTALFVSDQAVTARGVIYDPRVIRGGWGGVHQQIELRASGLSGLSTSVTLADPDGRVRNALVSADQRNSTAQIIRIIPGSLDDYDIRFTGLLDSWEFRVNEVRLNFKTDERYLKSYFPQWPFLRAEWFQMDLSQQGKYGPMVYGKHDSTGLSLDHGMVPTVPTWLSAASNSWYVTNLGLATLIKDVYITVAGVTTKDDPANYLKNYGNGPGLKAYTLIDFAYGGGSNPGTDDVITADLYGYSEDFASNDYTGNACITNPVQQLRHFIVNFAVGRSRGSTAWTMTNPLLHTASWDTAATWADNHGLEGSRYMAEQRTAMDWIREWCESFPMFRPYWNTSGQIALQILSAEWPGYWTGSTEVVRREDCLGNSFQYETDPGDVTGKISIQYLRDSVDNSFLKSLDIQDLSTGALEDTSIQMYWAPARQA
ncbi:MAG: hypothetical protein RL409_217 [Gemmatimonadota bacterium]